VFKLNVFISRVFFYLRILHLLKCLKCKAGFYKLLWKLWDCYMVCTQQSLLDWPKFMQNYFCRTQLCEGTIGIGAIVYYVGAISVCLSVRHTLVLSQN